jgi:Trypsin-like serine proteases, typically periplasmic, contain C-terminal PDZ domain
MNIFNDPKQKGLFPKGFHFVWVIMVVLGFAYGIYHFHHRMTKLQNQLIEVSQNLEKEAQAVKAIPLPVTPAAVAAQGHAVWIDVQRQVKNTVVKLVVDYASFNWLEPYKAPAVAKGSGSGFFINGDGDIITNYHVINDAQLIQIQIPALGIERLKAEIVGVSPERDVALLRLAPESKTRIEKELGKIPFLKIGDSDAVRRGQDVLALGYPLGVEALKSTQGIVSGRERISLIKQSCIQTTAPLNPGNSGGPSINSTGEVIGINFAGVVQAQNVGYIIPINDVKSTLKDMRKVKLLRRPVLGGLLEPANESMCLFLGNPQPGGYYIAKIFKNMLFEKVGIVEGDMIYEVNGFKLDRFGSATVPWNEDKVSMVDILDRLEIGDKVNMVVYRKGKLKEFSFILEPRFLQPVRYIYPDFEKVDYEVVAGLIVMELRQNHIQLLAEESHALLAYESPENQYDPALILVAIQPTSLASELRLLNPGAIITQVNGIKVTTLAEYRAAVKKSKSTRFLTMNTKDNLFIVLSTDKIVADEDRLAKVYQFKKSPLINEIA